MTWTIWDAVARRTIKSSASSLGLLPLRYSQFLSFFEQYALCERPDRRRPPPSDGPGAAARFWTADSRAFFFCSGASVYRLQLGDGIEGADADALCEGDGATVGPAGPRAPEA